MRQILGVDDRRSAALGGMQDQSVPVRNLVPRFDPEGCDDRLRSVDDDLPTQVVLNQLCDLIAGQRMLHSATKIHAELLQDLRTQSSMPRGPQMLNQLTSAFVLRASLALMGVNQNVGVDEIFGTCRGHSSYRSTLVKLVARPRRSPTQAHPFAQSCQGASPRTIVALTLAQDLLQTSR